MGDISIADVVNAKVTARKAIRRASVGGQTSRNLENLKQQVDEEEEDFHYSPLVSEEFLREWLNFPINRSVYVGVPMLPLRWMIWTNKSMAGLEPTDSTIRERVCNSISVLGTAAGLFLVIAVSALLQPPLTSDRQQHMLINIYGIVMFASTASLTIYIVVALTVVFPLFQSLRDDMAFDAFENYKKRWGGYELYFFNLGLQMQFAGYLIAAVVLYSQYAVWTMIALFFTFYAVAVRFSQQSFLALDPISSMHLGLTNSPEDIYRAELISRYIIKKVPNKLLESKSLEGVETAEPEVAESVKSKLNKLVHRNDIHPVHKPRLHSLPDDLEQVFFGNDAILLQGAAVLPPAVAEEVYNTLMSSGCTSTSLLVAYLNDSKVHATCHCHHHSTEAFHMSQDVRKPLPSKSPVTLGRKKAATYVQDFRSSAVAPEPSEHSLPAHTESYDDLHDPDCPQRKPACWQDALFKLLEGKLSTFYCYRLICCLKPHLK